MTCENCGRTIGNLEIPSVYNEHIVCSECHDRLATPVATIVAHPQINYASPAAHDDEIDMRPAPISVAPSRRCPACGSTLTAKKKAKGSSVLLIILLLLWIIPGLIYMIVYNGYVYVCPACGFKYGDAT